MLDLIFTYIMNSNVLEIWSFQEKRDLPVTSGELGLTQTKATEP